MNLVPCLLASTSPTASSPVWQWAFRSQSAIGAHPAVLPAPSPPPFGRVESVFLSDLTQTGALQGIAALNYVINARLTRLNTKKGGGQRVHLPAGTAGGFLWFCQNVQIDHSRFGHERRVAPTPDGEGV
eukprot:COSAG05_NODE_12218_length_477_cov_0.944444_1_plen_128_part_01